MPVFSSTYSPLFLALILIISAGISYFFYRKSNLSSLKKYFLITLRAFAIFLLVSLFIEPVLSTIIKNDDMKLDIILVDNSRSNVTSVSGISKTDEIKRTLSENNILNTVYKIFTFSR